MSKDIIYKEDAIEAIHSYWKGELNKMPMTDREYGEVIDGDCDTFLKYNKELSTRIKDIPSADRPQGEWTHDTSSPIAYRCSVCNTLQHWSVIQNGRYHFCPNCGARMKGVDNENI